MPEANGLAESMSMETCAESSFPSEKLPESYARRRKTEFDEHNVIWPTTIIPQNSVSLCEKKRLGLEPANRPETAGKLQAHPLEKMAG